MGQRSIDLGPLPGCGQEVVEYIRELRRVGGASRRLAWRGRGLVREVVDERLLATLRVQQRPLPHLPR